MRKELKIVLALGFGLGLAGTASATPDLYHAQSADPCAVCHSLSSAKGWVDAGTGAGSNWLGRNGPAKCYLCHGTALYGATNQVLNAYGNGNSLVHMYSVGNLPTNLAGQAMTIPANYFIRNIAGIDANNVDCITCHDVHSRTNRPYLAQAATIEQLCIDCHGRTWSGTKAAGNTTAAGRSTHPQNVPYTFNQNNGEAYPNAYTYRSDLNAADVTRDFAEVITTTFTTQWTLGAHARSGVDGAAGVPIDCQTCHVVHGGDDYAIEAVSGSRAPEAGLLVAGITGSAPGTTTRTKSPVCQGCHMGGTDENETVQPASLSGTAKDHPIGIRRLTYIPINRRTTAADDDASNGTGATQGWTRYWGGTAGTGEVPLCVTCHDVHGGISATALYRVASQAYDPTNPGTQVAQTAANYCSTCHADGSPLAHHSHKANYTTSQIVCEDCHGLPGTRGYQAHGDFFTAFVAAATDISVTLPGSGTYALTAAEQNANQKSALCVRCHDPADPTTFNAAYPPLLSAALTDTPSGNVGSMPARHGNLSRGTASHQVLRTDNNSIGQSGPQYASGGNVAGMGVMPVTEFPLGAAAYNSRFGTPINNYAKYGVTGGVSGSAPPAPNASSLVICESCHNVLTNVGTRAIAGAAVPSGWTSQNVGYRTNLLLQLYEDDWGVAADAPVETANEVAATYDFDAAATDSAFCTACHPFAAVTAPHVHGEPNAIADWGGGLEVAQAVTWAAATPEAAALAVYPLRPSTDFPMRSVGAGGASGWLTWRSGAGNWTKFDCDACHRPHNAATTSVVLGNTFSADPAPLITEKSGPIDATAGSPTLNNPQMRAEMCDQCHQSRAL